MKTQVFKNWSWGYMPSFDTNLTSETQFAKKHFDFIEITLRRNLKKYTEEYLKTINKALGGFKTLGHLHWETNLNNKDEVLKNLQVYRRLNVQKITVHPASNADWKLIIDFCRKNKVELLVENSGIAPFNSPEEFTQLFKQYSFLGMTLDIGHCGFVSKKEYKNYLGLFTDKIEHVHLHYTKNKQFDHLPFKDKTELKNILRTLNKFNVKQTITLEIFNGIKNGKPLVLNNKARQKCVLEELVGIQDFKI